MIPARITKTHIAEAIRRIIRDGVPPRRRGRGYCLVTNGEHLPPKYTIALAHQVATGECLRPGRFSGGAESNGFLRLRGFDVVECNCGGSVHDGRITSVSGPSERKRHMIASTRHSERCPECKIRVGELLERIYGTCVPNHRFGWQTGLAPYAGTSIGSALRDVATVLETHRGFGIGDFVRRDALVGCDFWVPDPGFIVEFDESQHLYDPAEARALRVRRRPPSGVLHEALDGAMRRSRCNGQRPPVPRRTTRLVRHAAGPRPVNQGLAADGETLCS